MLKHLVHSWTPYLIWAYISDISSNLWDLSNLYIKLITAYRKGSYRTRQWGSNVHFTPVLFKQGHEKDDHHEKLMFLGLPHLSFWISLSHIYCCPFTTALLGHCAQTIDREISYNRWRPVTGVTSLIDYTLRTHSSSTSIGLLDRLPQ